MRTQKVEYQDNGTLLEGYLTYNSDISKARPTVLIAHDWSGRNDFACQKAEAIAELGYVGFAIDMFGKDKFGRTIEEKSALIKPFTEDRNLLLRRILSAYQTLKKIDVVDMERVAAIGFCFGGMCVLDLARAGTDIQGVVSFHGLLNPPQESKKRPIKAKILACHGFDDPMVPPEVVLAFQEEMTELGADWQMHIYGNTMHAFTNPNAHDPSFGTVYNNIAETRSWTAMRNFLKEIFTK
jgi:dienelactone hydrolase